MSDETTTKPLAGSCLCGSVTYTATGDPKRFYHCHCKRCRKATGTGHASNLFLKGTIEWHSGQQLISRFKLPGAERFGNTFCSQCGSRMPTFIEKAGIVMIPAGSLDDEPAFEVQARIFSDSRAKWSCSHAELPQFTEYPA